MDYEHLIQKVSKWASMLEKEDKISHALRRLESVSITLQVLSDTGVGKAVNALRKHPTWGDRASALVARWKDIARAETAAAEQKKCEDDYEKESNGSISDVETNKDSVSYKKMNNYVNEPELNASSNEYIPTPIMPKKVKSSPVLPKSDQKLLMNDIQPIDAFSEQLAAADKVSNIKTKKKVNKITSESIQSSIRDSLSSSIFISQAAQQCPQQQQIFLEASPSLDINMFKKPKENRRVYAGRKKTGFQLEQQVPKLYDICIRLLLNNIEAIEETGDIPFHVLKPILEKATAIQLFRLEEINPYLQEETDYIWRIHCEKEFSKELNDILCVLSDDEEDDEEEKKEDNSDNDNSDDEKQKEPKYVYNDDCSNWRQRYYKFFRERDYKLKNLSKKIRTKTTELAEPQRKAMVTAPIAPRHVRRRQIASGMVISADAVPSAVDLTRARRQIFQNGKEFNFKNLLFYAGNNADLRQMPSAIRNTNSQLGARSSGSDFSPNKRKPQRGPLMMKTLKMLKKQRR